jgi:acyl-CoA synthetase (AMP-forming)/AMP-acid ligase II
LTCAELDARVDRAAAALQRDGIGQGESIAICAGNSIEYVEIYLGAVRAGVVAVLLPTWTTADSLVHMLKDSDGRLLFLDKPAADALAPVSERIDVPLVRLDREKGAGAYGGWLALPGARPAAVALMRDGACNILYSSGSTGAPKGVVQSYGMRWIHAEQGRIVGRDAVMMISTPLCTTGGSTTLLMTLGAGGTAVLMRRFDPRAFLEQSERSGATHATLTPTQYGRILAEPDFDRFDLSSFRMTFSMAAPASPALKAEILRRWPGGLTEIYGATEGGACVLRADLRPDKLHTVGRPGPATELKIIDDAGRELPIGEAGEVVAHSAAIMIGYYKQPERTREAEWRDGAGRRFFRTGDIGRLDNEGFLTLLDRKKDLIISGGVNVFPRDLEEVLHAHEDVEEAAVVGAPSERWGETPVAFVVLRAGRKVAAAVLLAWANARLGRFQRLSEVRLLKTLPRTTLGKVLKRALRERLADEAARQS